MLVAHQGRVGSTVSLRASTSAISRPALPVRRAKSVVVRASADPDAELEARLEKLRKSKGATPYGESRVQKPAPAAKPSAEAAAAAPAKVEYDFAGETLYMEGPPHRGDLALNLALGTTLIWLPLSIAAIGRSAFVKYRFTDRRLSVQSTAPWKKEQTDVAYQEVKDIVTVSRGLGLWGDMVISLRDNSKVELRSVDKYKELKEYILKRRDELGPGPSAAAAPKAARAAGREISAAELMGEDVAPASKKGF